MGLPASNLELDRVRAQMEAIDRMILLRLEHLRYWERIPVNVNVIGGFDPLVDKKHRLSSSQIIAELRRQLEHYRSSRKRPARRLDVLVARKKASKAVQKGLKEARGAIEGAIKGLAPGAGLDSDALDKIEADCEKVILDNYLPLLKKDPSPATIIETMRGLGMCASINNSGLEDGNKPEIVRALQKATLSNHEAADRAFRNSPTLMNFRRLAAAEQLAQEMDAGFTSTPKGWKSAGKTHLLTSSDTLPALSVAYYGAARYWDVIYRENVDVIGLQPDKLPAGRTITIP